MTFNINYKGTTCRGTTFIYICTTCAYEHNERHPASEEPTVYCHDLECDGICIKKPTVPALDADHHDSMLSHNIGWDSDG